LWRPFSSSIAHEILAYQRSKLSRPALGLHELRA
jgi:hypothetical protein